MKGCRREGLLVEERRRERLRQEGWRLQRMSHAKVASVQVGRVERVRHVTHVWLLYRVTKVRIVVELRWERRRQMLGQLELRWERRWQVLGQLQVIIMTPVIQVMLVYGMVEFGGSFLLGWAGRGREHTKVGVRCDLEGEGGSPGGAAKANECDEDERDGKEGGEDNDSHKRRLKRG